MLRGYAPLAFLLILSARALAAPPVTDPVIDFARDIQPILSDNCYFCHGPDANHRKADLRLDLLDPKEGPTAPREGYAILAPGKPEASEMVARLTNPDEAERMPPPKSNRKLTPVQIDTIRRWVEQGATWGKHWSLVPPTRPHQPVVKDAAWPKNAIDRFVLAKLEARGIKPSPEADRPTLIRRVTLDLTGLPPTPEEVDAFVADASSDAYEKVVDRLLVSPRYGEHMAWPWLDAARYSDTNGYQNDPTRTMWPWRDWVIRALNDNLPFDDFVTWQIAGDLIPGATQEQRLASGFNRNHPFNGEGGRISEETRVENVMDRAETTATAFLGLTVGCARCHDHKFDPISHKEYYGFYAFFNNSAETGEQRYINGGNVAPVMTVMSDAERRTLAFHQREAKAAADQLAAALPQIDEAQAAWEKAAKPGVWKVTAPASVNSTAGATMRVQPDGAILVTGDNPDNDIHEVVLKTDLDSITGLRLDALQDESLPKGGPGRFEDSGNFVLTYIEAGTARISNLLDRKPLTFATADATHSQNGLDVAGAIEADPRTGWGILKAPDASKLSATFKFTETITNARDRQIRLRFHYASEHKRHTLGKFRLSLTDGDVLPPAVSDALAVPAEQRSRQQNGQIRSYYRTRVSPVRSLHDAANAAKQRVADFENSLTKVMVMDDAAPRETRVLDKGAYNAPIGERIEPGVLAVLNPLPPDAPKNRLTLARWMVDPANSLAARVAVNRYWQLFFGTGIVKTSEDFGVQGEQPSNQDLLDWLAVEFRERAWDVKAMHRLMVTSAAYRQSSKVTPQSYERDPENRLIARGPRFRLPAVVIRDQALAAGGLLVEKIGGPPVKPYQPPGIWEEATFGFIKYEQDHGEALYRRGAYVFWRRIVGPTGFFDASSRTVCTVKPNRTNTPLHALTTLNDVTYVEAARALAERAMHACDGDRSPAKLVDAAYRYVVGRAPRDKERGVLVASLARLKGQYANDKDAALKLLSNGESKRDEKLDPIDHAAMIGVCLAILNLDEVLNKE